MKVYVKTPARLHFGLIDMNGEMGRFFGGIGVGIDSPNVVLEAETSNTFMVSGEQKELVAKLVKRFLEKYSITGQVKIHVKQVIPQHAGLGSGTQLTLAVASALAKLFKINASTKKLSLSMCRMRRTGVGTTIFESGGFVVDGGKRMKGSKIDEESFPPLIFRYHFPEDWKFVVAIPNVKEGLAQTAEMNAFNRLPPMPSNLVGRVCWLTLMKLLPSLVDRDIEGFGDALTKIQMTVGGYFAEVQGGTFSSDRAKETIEFMHRMGVYGAGQSSWGPAVYGLVDGAEQAKELHQRVEEFIEGSGGGQVFVANANNQGAIIKQLRQHNTRY